MGGADESPLSSVECADAQSCPVTAATTNEAAVARNSEAPTIIECHVSEAATKRKIGDGLLGAENEERPSGRDKRSRSASYISS